MGEMRSLRENFVREQNYNYSYVFSYHCSLKIIAINMLIDIDVGASNLHMFFPRISLISNFKFIFCLS